jgi:hypothetical protein
MRAGRGQTESGLILGVVMKGARKSPMVTEQTDTLYRRFIQGKCSIWNIWMSRFAFHDPVFGDRISSCMDQTDGHDDSCRDS